MENVLFKGAIELQADVLAKTKAKSEATTNLNNAAFVQMVMFIAGNQSEKIKAGTKKAGQFQSELIEAHGFKKRHAQTITSISLNKNITKMVADGLAKLDEPQTGPAVIVQSVTDILAENELTSVNKLKAYVATPVDRVAKLLETIAKLEADEMDQFRAAFAEMVGEE